MKLAGSSAPCRDPASDGSQAGLFFFLVSPGWLLWGVLVPHILLVSLGFDPALRGNHFLGPVGRRPDQGFDVVVIDHFLFQEGVGQLNTEKVEEGESRNAHARAGQERGSCKGGGE